MNNKIKFAIIADPHYYSEKLGVEGVAYKSRENSDQKMLAHSGSIISAALDEVKNSDADFLLIAGDLSNDGERVSHEELREKLYDFKKSKPVFVITATHDWCCDNNPRRFEGDKVFNDVPTLKPDELRDFYKDFGHEDAISEFFTHQNKASYIVRPCEKLTVFCLDDDQDGNGSSGYSQEHFNWIKQEIENAKKRGDFIFGMQHHHLFTTEFDKVINGKGAVERRAKLCKDFADAGLQIMFTGHSHMHHIREIVTESNNNFFEFNVASISGYPAPIVYCTIENDTTLKTKTEHLKCYTYKDEVFTNDYLKKHATFLFENVFEAAKKGSKDEFTTLLISIGVSEKKAKKLWHLLGWIIKILAEVSVYRAAKIINFFTFKKAFTIKEAKKLKDVKIPEVVFGIFHSILDGSITKYEKGTPYYITVTEALSLPLKIVRKLKIKNDNLTRIFTHLEKAADEILTGGEIDANEATLKIYRG